MEIDTHRPRGEEAAFIASTAVVIGQVTIAREVSIWYGAVVRGDMAPIEIGPRSNVQEHATLHVDPGKPLRIGAGVTIGHNAVVHGATVGDDILIGMGAIVLNDAVIGDGSIIAAGCVVREGMIVPPGSLVAGVPGKVIKTITPEQAAHIRHNAEVYLACAYAHRDAGRHL